MALAATYIDAASFVDTTNVTSYVTTTYAFTSGSLYVVCVHVTDEATAEVPNSVVLSGSTPPTVTRETAATATFNTVAASVNRMTLWWFIGDGVSRTITVTQPDAATGGMIYTVEVTGADTAAPIVQAAGNQGDAGTTASATLAAFGDATNNGAIVFYGTDGGGLNPEAGGAWTEFNAGVDRAYTSPTSRMTGAFRIGEDTTPTMTSNVAQDWGFVAVEIKVALSISGYFGIPM